MKPRLDRQGSKLDLIDSSTLTSLPFPPPLKAGVKRSRVDLLANRSRSLPNISRIEPDLSPDPQYEDVSFTSIDTLTTQNMTTEIDDSFDDGEEPIIFVEDYMQPQTIEPQQKMFRQQSLANFKQKLNDRKRKHSGGDENLEEIFGAIPGKNMLKYCEICDKPLYEISSILNNKKLKIDADKQLSEIFNEFICVECIQVYEEFLNELYNQETDKSGISMTELKNLKLLNIFKSVQLRSLNSLPVSNNLVSRLQFLNSNSLTSELIELQKINWLKTLQNKLRWRWRLNGLIPSFKRNEK